MNKGNSSSFGVGKGSLGSFQSLELDKDILKGILRLGFKVPTPGMYFFDL